jgi:hypothetical protein
MIAIPPNFPEKITFNYLLDMSWNIYRENFFNYIIAAIIYVILSTVVSLIPILGFIFVHFIFTGLVTYLNHQRLYSQSEYKDIFWVFQSIKRVKTVSAISLIPIMTALPIVFFSSLATNMDNQYVIIAIIFIPLFVYALLISSLSIFVYVLEPIDFKKTINRSHEIIKGHFLDLFVIFLGIIIVNILGLISIVGVFITGPVTAIILLEFCRYLIRQFELNSI